MPRFKPPLIALALTLSFTPPALAQAPTLVVQAHLPDTTQARLDAARQRATASPESADAQFELAMAYARTPFLEQGWEALKQVNALDPQFTSKAIARYEAAIAADPTDVESRFRLGFGYYFQGDKEAARRQFELIVSLAPVEPWGYDYLGFLEAESGQLDAASANWQRALGIDPNNAVAHYLIGQAHYRQGRFLQAAQAVTTALRLRSQSTLKP